MILYLSDIRRFPLAGDAEPRAAAGAVPQLLARRRARAGSVRRGRQEDAMLLGKGQADIKGRVNMWPAGWSIHSQIDVKLKDPPLVKGTKR